MTLENINIDLILIPIIAALIGWFTNWVAVKMLFHPKDPRFIFGFNIQGVFPKRQQALAKKLGEIVSKELITPKDLSGVFTDSNKNVLGDAVLQVITKSLPEKFPLLAMVLNQELAEKIASVFVDSFSSTLGSIASEVQGSIVDEEKIKNIVEQKVLGFSSDKLESLLNEIMRREFQFIEVLGGVLGFIIGLVQVAIIRLTI